MDSTKTTPDVLLRPMGNRVLVVLEDVEDTTKGGIVLVASAQDKPQMGRVLALGSDQYQFTVQVNDLVTFKQYTNTKINHKSKKYLLIKKPNILTIIK